MWKPADGGGGISLVGAALRLVRAGASVVEQARVVVGTTELANGGEWYYFCGHRTEVV